MSARHEIFGRKSSGGKSGSSSGSSESANTLRSNAKARIVELLGEGEIVGLIDGAKSIYFDQTPLQSQDGTFNFKGVTWTQRVGLPDQDPVPGFPLAETTVAVGTEVKLADPPPVRTIVDQNVDAVRLVVSVPALAYQDPNKGTLQGASVSWVIETRPNGGSWSLRDTIDLVNEKSTSTYQRDSYITKPAGMAPGTTWDVRVRRITADATTVELQNKTFWDSYTLVVEGKFIYPDTAYIALEIDAQQFGNSIPSRSFRVGGRKVKIPSNYNPDTRAYTGVWDGNFVVGWTNNPVWIFYDLLTEKRAGLGEFIKPAIVDKWGLYTIGRYCDELVPSGYSDANGDPIMEPRFVYNGQINTRAEAYKVLEMILTSFRGMGFWSLGQVIASADMPADPAPHGLFAPANVIDGHFTYSGTARKARHSVALVSWNDPQDFYRPAIEVVQNDEMLHRFGWFEVPVQAHGCTSRGQAHRYGKWILDSEQYETDTVSFGVSWEGAKLKPGDIILVADPDKAAVRTGGRLADVTDAANVTLDKAYDFQSFVANVSHSLSVVLPDGTVATKPISAVSGALVTLQSSFAQLPAANAMWAITEAAVNPRRFRVMGVEEMEENIFQITALFNDPQKYARVELGIKLDPISYTRARDIIGPPTNLDVVESLRLQNGVASSTLTLSWTPPSGFVARGYRIWANTPTGTKDYGETTSTSIDIEQAPPGGWKFFVCAVSMTGKPSVAADFTFTCLNWEGADGPSVASLQVKGGGFQFSSTGVTLTWTNTLPTGVLIYDIENVVRIKDFTTNALLRTETVRQNSYTYSIEKNVADGGPRRKFKVEVTAKSIVGVESTAATATIENPVPAAVTPNLMPVPRALNVTFAAPQDLDFHGARVWIDSSPSFTPTDLNYVFEGIGNSHTIPWTAGTYYVWVGAFDRFGRTGLNLSTMQSVVITNVLDGGVVTLPTLAADAVTLFDQEVAAWRDMGAAFTAEMTRSETERRQRVTANGVNASFNERITTAANDVAAVAERTTVLEASNTSLNARVTAEESARVAGDLSLASAVTTVEANYVAADTVLQGAYIAADGVLQGNIDSEAAARAAADTTISASVTTEATARANADTALGDWLSSVTAGSASSASANSRIRMTAVTAPAGVAARVEIQARVAPGTGTGDQNNWKTAGLILDAVETSPGSGVYAGRIILSADQVAIEQSPGGVASFPFAVVGGVVRANLAHIGEVTAGVIRNASGKFRIDLDQDYLLVSD